MNLLDAIVPPSALLWEKSRRDRIDAVLFDCTAVVQPPPFALDDDCNIVENLERFTDDELDDMTVIHRDPIDFDTVRMLLRWADEDRRPVPHPLSWRRWEVSRPVARWLSARGLVSLGYVGDWSGSYLSLRRRRGRS